MPWITVFYKAGTAVTAQSLPGELDWNLIDRVLLTNAQPAELRDKQPYDSQGQPMEFQELSAADIVDLAAILAAQPRVRQVGDRISLQGIPQGIYVIHRNGTQLATVVSDGTLEFTVRKPGVYTLTLADKPCTEFSFFVQQEEEPVLEI